MAGGRVPGNGQIVNAETPLGAAPVNRIRYVNKVGSDGWLQARVGASAVLQPLCKYTQVQIIESKDDRTYFKVMDGPAKGRTLNLGDANASVYLGSTAPKPTAAELVVAYGKYTEGWVSVARNGEKLDQQLATLTVDGITVQVTMNTDWSQNFTPLPPGTYKVLIPDAPHSGDYTRFYRKTEPSLKHDQVWFPIQYGDNSRYVHVGNVSDGCTTVLDLARWADVHEALISHRAPDGVSVATLKVTGKPERDK